MTNNAQPVPVSGDILDKLIDTMTRQNKNSVALRNVLAELSEKIDKISDTTATSDQFGDKEKKKKSSGSLDKQSEAFESAISRFEKVLNEFSKREAGVLSKAEKVKSKSKSSKTDDGFDEDFAHPKKYEKLKSEKGWAGRLRRGMVDVDNQIPVGADDRREKIGRFAGKALAWAGGVTMDERRKAAEEQLYPDLRLDRATSADPKVRDKIDASEQLKVDDYEYQLKAGKIDTKGLNHTAALKKFKEDLVTKNNLHVLESKRPDHAPDYQAESRHKLGMKVTEKEKNRQEKKEVERATSTNKGKQQSLLPHEQRVIDDVKAKYESGEIPLPRGKTAEDMVQKMSTDMINKSNMKQLEKYAPEKLAKYKYDFVPGSDIKTAPQPVKPAPQQVKLDPIDHKMINSGGSNVDVNKNTQQPMLAPINMSSVSSSPKVNAVESPVRAVGASEHKMQPVVTKVKNSANHGATQSLLPPAMQSSGSGNIASALSNGIAALRTMTIGDMSIKSLNIQSLMIPEKPQDKKDSVESTEASGGADAQPSSGGISDMVPDINIGGKGAGKFGKFLGKAGRLAGKAALPLAAGMALYDGVSGYNNANENLGIEGREATFGEKMSSAAGSVASGLTLGLVDGKSASKGISNFFGAGPSTQVTQSETVSATISEDYDGRGRAMVEGREVAPLPDQKQSELAAAKEENDLLKQEERDRAQTGNNTVINAPTSISNNGGKQAPVQSSIRANHDAHSRFVGRVYTGF